MTDQGVDCSGLVWQAHFQAGLALPRDARDQAKLGRPVSMSDLRPGDALYFRTRGKAISHTGIYVGDGRMIHSSGRRGVVVESIRSGYYSTCPRMARRFL